MNRSRELERGENGFPAGVEEVEASGSLILDQLFEGRTGRRLLDLVRLLNNDSSIKLTAFISLTRKNSVRMVGRKDQIAIQLCGNDMDGYQLLVGDIRCGKMVVLRAKSIMDKPEKNSNEMKEDGIIDMGSTGRRWEGGVLNGCECCGYGKEYNEENIVVYEGFMFGGMRVCYGKEYRGIRDNQNGKNGLVYEGGYCNGDRYGFGKSCDLNGNVEYEGEWANNLPKHELGGDNCILRVGDNLVVSALSEELMIGNESFNDETIRLFYSSPLLTRLKRVEIGKNCFKNVREFVLDGLEQLESVKIGDHCFRASLNRECDDGVCRITNCPNLCQLEIGDGTFGDFKKFELSNVDSLQAIIIHSGCFEYADCVLKDLPSLQKVTIEWASFVKCHLAQFENLPKLTTISLSIRALAGDGRNTRTTIINGHESYDNTLIMKNLPSLTSIQHRGHENGIHQYMGRVILENIPMIAQENVDYGHESLEYTAELQATNADGLRDAITLYSKYNLVKEGMQTREKYFVPPNQSLQDIPKDVENLYFCGYGNEEDFTVLDFSSFGFTHLRSITIGSHCFANIENLTFKDIATLQSLVFQGKRLFEFCNRAVFEDLPNLTTIVYNGYDILAGDGRNTRRTIINGHESNDNTLIMKKIGLDWVAYDWLDLPSLTSVGTKYSSFQGGIHRFMGRVIFEDIPNLTLANCHFGGRSFEYTDDIQATNAVGLESYIQRERRMHEVFDNLHE